MFRTRTCCKLRLQGVHVGISSSRSFFSADTIVPAAKITTKCRVILFQLITKIILLRTGKCVQRWTKHCSFKRYTYVGHDRQFWLLNLAYRDFEITLKRHVKLKTEYSDHCINTTTRNVYFSFRPRRQLVSKKPRSKWQRFDFHACQLCERFLVRHRIYLSSPGGMLDVTHQSAWG